MTPRGPLPQGDIDADPFRERRAATPYASARLLGGDFEFIARDARLRRIIEHAYGDLPRHDLARRTPRFRVHLEVVRRAAPSARSVPRIEMLSGATFLCAATGASTFAAISPAERAAVIAVSRGMLRHEYHVRYELLEFAVFTLAARAQGLVPLHAACVGLGGRGVLLMGDSGAGKTTAALGCLIRGFELVSEDSAFVARHSMLATGVANFLHVRRESLGLLPRSVAAILRGSPEIRRRSGVVKLEIDARRAPFRLAPKPVAVKALVFLTAKVPNRGEALVPLRRSEIVRRLAAAQPYAAGRPEWNDFVRRLGSVPTFELRRSGDPGETAETLARLLSDPHRR